MYPKRETTVSVLWIGDCFLNRAGIENLFKDYGSVSQLRSLKTVFTFELDEKIEIEFINSQTIHEHQRLNTLPFTLIDKKNYDFILYTFNPNSQKSFNETYSMCQAINNLYDTGKIPSIIFLSVEAPHDRIHYRNKFNELMKIGITVLSNSALNTHVLGNHLHKKLMAIKSKETANLTPLNLVAASISPSKKFGLFDKKSGSKSTIEPQSSRPTPRF